MKNLGDKEEDGALGLGGAMLALGRRPGTISAGGNSSSVLFVRQRRIAGQVTTGATSSAAPAVRPVIRPEVRLPQNQMIE